MSIERARSLSVLSSAELGVLCSADGALDGSIDVLAPTLDSPARSPSAQGAQAPLSASETGQQTRHWERYKILEFLGAGGMGRVYKARDLRLNRTVAIKYLRSEQIDASDSSQWRRFAAEARAQACIEHPNICKIYDFGVAQGQPYIAMQLIVGSRLDKFHAKMTREHKLRIIRSVAEALHSAHQLGIIHRDIKPANILVELRGNGAYWPYLMDFGLARQIDSSLHNSTVGIAGTPGYMSPEQARGDVQLDHRTDVYGLGATMYSILCGRPPFSGSPTEMLVEVLSKSPRPMRTIDKTIPQELDTLVLKCLEKEPAQRYQSVKELADDLERHLAGERIAARRPPLVQRLVRFARGHKLLVASSLLVLSVIVLMGGVALRARLQAAEEARLAQHLGHEIAKMEWFLRSARQVPLHNLAREQAIIGKRIQRLQSELSGSDGGGLLRYALGRGHLALREYPQALAELQRAVQKGYRSAELDYALGLALGKHFERALNEARLSGSGEWAQRQIKEKELEPRYLVPAIAALQRSRGAQLEAPEYLEALLSFYRRDYAATLRHTASVMEESPWMYEAAKLSGDAHHELALQARDRGRYDEAQREFASAIRSYERAAASGQSDAEVYAGLAETRVRQVEMLAARSLPAESAYAAAREAADKIAVIEPQGTAGPLKKAFAALLSLSISGAGPAPQARIEECVEAAEAVLKREPGNPYASEAAASCYARAAELALAQGRDPEPLWSRASAVLEAALERSPRFLWGLNDLGNVYVIRGAYRAQRGHIEARRDLERALQKYRAATALDEGYLIGWQNMLGCLDELVLLTSQKEQEEVLIPLADHVFGRCQAMNSQYPPCHVNYAIFYVRLARLRFLGGGEHGSFLESARARFAELKRLGGSYLDAEQHRAALHLIDASKRVREQHDPSPAQAELAEALKRCFALAAADPTCQILAAQAEWVDADRLALGNRPVLPALNSALAKAKRAAQGPQQSPDAWWTLAATHLRLARAPGHRSAQAELRLHLRQGLEATERALAINPSHEPARQTQRELRLLAAGAEEHERRAASGRHVAHRKDGHAVRSRAPNGTGARATS